MKIITLLYAMNHSATSYFAPLTRGMATLIEAVQECNREAVFSHLEKGADPNECTRLGLSTLHLAAVHNEVCFVKEYNNVNLCYAT